MDWLLERTVHRGMVGMSIGKAVFTDLDFADDVALLAEMLSVLVLALEVMNEEAQPLGWRLSIPLCILIPNFCCLLGWDIFPFRVFSGTRLIVPFTFCVPVDLI